MKRKLQGIVVSDASNKTIVVRVDRMKTHSLYHKKYKVSRRYKVHDEKNEHKIGDSVLFEQCRPISKEKKWRVIKHTV